MTTPSIADRRIRCYLNPVRVSWPPPAPAAPARAERLCTESISQSTVWREPLCTLRHGDMLVCDFGREIHGGLQLVVKNTPGNKPVPVKITFGESISEALTEPNQDHAIHSQILLLPWAGIHEVGSTGFRFVRIEAVEPYSFVELLGVRAVTLMQPEEQVGFFECSDDRLNTIWNTGAYTLQLCMQEYLWDGIKRDRLVWAGDLHPEVMTLLSVFGNHPIVPSSLRFLREDSPLPAWMNGMPPYSLWWIITLRDWWLHTGDRATLDENRDYLRRLLEMAERHVDAEGQERLPSRFLDWATASDPAALAVGSHALMRIAMTAGAELCAVFGEVEMASRCHRAEERLSLFHPSNVKNQQANALRVLAGLADADDVNRNIFQPDPAAGLSPFYAYYVLEARSAAGDVVGALDLIRQYWGGMLDFGATSFWEHFDMAWVERNPKPTRIDEWPMDGRPCVHRDFGDYCYKGYRHSLCHAWASGPTSWLSRQILGITPATPGFGSVHVRPNLGDLQWAKRPSAYSAWADRHLFEKKKRRHYRRGRELAQRRGSIERKFAMKFLPTIACWICVTFAVAAQAQPLLTIDLASTNEWTAKRQTETEWKTTTVPCQISVKKTNDQWIDYRRNVTIPNLTADQATILRLSSINDGGQIFIDDRPVQTVLYGLFPAAVDLTQFVTLGKSVVLTVRCYSCNHFYPGGVFPQDHNGEELLGMPRGIELQIEPAIYLDDVVIRPSVTEHNLQTTVVVVNTTASQQQISLKSSLDSPQNIKNWHYPALPDQPVTLAPHSETSVDLKPVKWTLDPSSYWWPNIPFREDYGAVLHQLNVTIESGEKSIDSITRRFGFAEYGEDGSHYTINGISVFEFQDGTQEHLWNPPGQDGFQTSYVQLDGWKTTAAAAETWRKYMRLGFNCFRMHSSAGSETMLDAADEVGFMLVGESGIRGYAKPEEEWSDTYKPAAIQAMCRRYRNHPSVVRYSLDNEWAEVTRKDSIARGLIDAAVSEDPTRPLSFSQDKPPWVQKFIGSDGTHHAWVLDHYHLPVAREGELSGIEESSWDRHGTDRNELIECARSAIVDRMKGLAVFSPWTLNNYWCNFVAGGSKATGTTNIIWRNKDRQDGVDGWGSDIIRFMQNCYSIYAAADVDLIENHLNAEQLIFDPARAEQIVIGTVTSRKLVQFNNSLQPHAMSIVWELHMKNPDGAVVDSGETPTATIQPAGCSVRSIEVHCKGMTDPSNILSFVVKSKVDGSIAFVEDRYIFRASDSTTGPTSAPNRGF